MTASVFLIGFAQGWLVLGAAVAIAFVLFGMDIIDEDARGALTFRPLIVPGVILIWPLVLWRWWELAHGGDNWHLRHKPPRQAHAVVVAVMAVVVTLTLGSAYALRQTWPADVPAVRLAPAAEVTQ